MGYMNIQINNTSIHFTYFNNLVFTKYIDEYIYIPFHIRRNIIPIIITSSHSFKF